jgi:hypothetical protein
LCLNVTRYGFETVLSDLQRGGLYTDTLAALNCAEDVSAPAISDTRKAVQVSLASAMPFDEQTMQTMQTDGTPGIVKKETSHEEKEAGNSM